MIRNVAGETLFRGARPRMNFDTERQKLYVEFRNDITRTYCVVTHDPTAAVVNVRRIRRVGQNETFNVPGMHGVSFVSGESSLESECAVKAWSMIQLRPWLRDGRCMYGDRQGTFGHYFTQCSMIAAPLT